MYVYPQTCALMHMRTHGHTAHTYTKIYIEGRGANVTEASKMFDFEDQCRPLCRPGKEPPIAENWE